MLILLVSSWVLGLVSVLVVSSILERTLISNWWISAKATHGCLLLILWRNEVRVAII